MIRVKFRFLIGVLLGFNLFQLVSWLFKSVQHKSVHTPVISSHLELYQQETADFLYNEVKILCWIMISPTNHQTRGVHIKNTWGKRCNKLLFMSSIEDPELDSVALPVKNTKSNLWPKTKAAFKFISKNHLNDYDWFLKADDDTFMIMENVRHLLHQYRPGTALYFGHRMTGNGSLDGFMQGGAYILSRKAVEKFVQRAPSCYKKKSWAEDLYLGICLTNKSIFVDTRDDKQQARFLMFGVRRFFSRYDPDDWFFEKAFFKVREGSLECCSDVPVGFHYVKNIHEIYLLEYLVYHVHPFGARKNLTDKLPRKLSLQEILTAADVGSDSRLYKKHKVVHDMESSEIF